MGGVVRLLSGAIIGCGALRDACGVHRMYVWGHSHVGGWFLCAPGLRPSVKKRTKEIPRTRIGGANGHRIPCGACNPMRAWLRRGGTNRRARVLQADAVPFFCDGGARRDACSARPVCVCCF